MTVRRNVWCPRARPNRLNNLKFSTIGKECMCRLRNQAAMGNASCWGRSPFPTLEVKHAIVKNTKTSHGSKPFSTALCSPHTGHFTRAKGFVVCAASSGGSSGQRNSFCAGAGNHAARPLGQAVPGWIASPEICSHASHPAQPRAVSLSRDASVLRLSLQAALAAFGCRAGPGCIGGRALAVRLGGLGRRLEIRLVALWLLVLGESGLGVACI